MSSNKSRQLLKQLEKMKSDKKPLDSFQNSEVDLIEALLPDYFNDFVLNAVSGVKSMSSKEHIFIKDDIRKVKSLIGASKAGPIKDLPVTKNILQNSRSVAMVFNGKDLQKVNQWGYHAKSMSLKEYMRYTTYNEKPFKDEVYEKYNCLFGAVGSGFLIAPDILISAGHNFRTRKNKTIPISEFKFLFNQVDLTPTSSGGKCFISEKNVYSGVEYLDIFATSSRRDYAVIKLDRKAENQSVCTFRKKGKIQDDQKVYVIGHPLGMSMSFAANASVKRNDKKNYFVTDLDGLKGNSGSPVFNADNHQVEGILVKGILARGKGDIILSPDGKNYVINKLEYTPGLGEKCQRITELKKIGN